MSSSKTFTNKNILITGAGRGIGKRLAIGFASLGARIGILSRSKAEIDLAHIEIEQVGGNALRLRADVTDAEQVQVAVDRMKVQFGSVDVLICAAAVPGPLGPFLQNQLKAWHEAIQINLLGIVHACRAVLPQMAERRHGKIVALACEGASSLRPNFSAYATAKAGIVRFVETVAAEVRDDNVQVNCVDPGPTYTNMTDEIIRAEDRVGSQVVHQALEVRRTGGTSPDKQLELVKFLVSESANHITGKLIYIGDDWKKLKHQSPNPEMYTLRRVQKI